MEIKDAEVVSIDQDLDNAVNMASRLYLEGAVFVYPTDTIYGFGANPFNEDAVRKIDQIKGRSPGKQYIWLIDSIETLLKYVDLNSEKHIDFLLSIWPNPISVILRLNNGTAKLYGEETVAFRIPNNRFCRRLLSQLKMPLISTSVNKSGQQSLTEPSVIKDIFASEVDAIFFSEKKSYDQQSTLIDLTGDKPEIKREGKFKPEDLLQKFNSFKK